MEKEIWKFIKETNNLYQVSNLGRIRSYHNNDINIINGYVNKGGYKCVLLTLPNKRIGRFVHKLVATHFINNPNPNIYTQINHKDENKLNNTVENLEWCTSKYNCNYGNRNNKMSVPVYQYTKDYKLVRKWDSTHQIEKELNISKGQISKAINHKLKYVKGYIWSSIPISNFHVSYHKD